MRKQETQAQWNERRLRELRRAWLGRVASWCVLALGFFIVAFAFALMLSSETAEPGFPGW